MSELKVQVLRFYEKGVNEFSWLTDTGNGFDGALRLPFDIPIISLHIMDIGKIPEKKANAIFKAITGHDMPKDMVACIPAHYIKISETCANQTGYKNNQYLILENQYDDLYLVDGFTFPYFQLLKKDIFAIYITDKENDEKEKESIKNLESIAEPYILEKHLTRSDSFNYGSYLEMTRKDCLTSILNYNIFKMMKCGCSKENIAFLIVYDNVSIDKIIETEQVAQKTGIYYESIFVGEKKGNIYNIDSIDGSHISISKLPLPVFGENVIKIN